MSKEKEDEEESVLKVSGKLKVRTKATYCRYGRDPRKVWNGRVIGLRAITWTLGRQARANMVARLLVMCCGGEHGANDDHRRRNTPRSLYTAQRHGKKRTLGSTAIPDREWTESNHVTRAFPGPAVDARVERSCTEG